MGAAVDEIDHIALWTSTKLKGIGYRNANNNTEIHTKTQTENCIINAFAKVDPAHALQYLQCCSPG